MPNIILNLIRSKRRNVMTLDTDASALSQPHLEAAVEITHVCTEEEISMDTQEVDMAMSSR